MKKIKSFFDNNNYKKYLELMKVSKLPYSIKSSNYTLEIVSDYLNIYFTQNHKSKRAFVGYAKIKKDIKDKNLTPPDIDTNELMYFTFSMPERLKKSNKIIYNIDLNMAYATTLYINNIITEETFDYIKSLSKVDRLACVGMLASRKNEFHYDGNDELISYNKYINPLSSFFFMCVLETQKTMQHIAHLLGDDFIFFWVDGIYFENENNRKMIEDYLQEKGYKNTFEKLTDFVFIEKKNVDFLFFKKYDDKTKQWKEKFFNLPKRNSNITREVLNLLGLYNTNNLINLTEKNSNK